MCGPTPATTQAPIDLTRRAPHTQVELLLLRLSDVAGSPRVAFRRVSAPLLGGRHPDEVALSLSGGPAAVADLMSVVHSTSWRFSHEEGVVLTYAALPDPDLHLPATTLDLPAIVCSGDAARPSPPGLHLHHVVAHAVHHLTQLAGRDPGIRRAAQDPAQRVLWEAMAAATAVIPTDTHDQAHARAHDGVGGEIPRPALARR